jgi:hypothetical protein
MTACQRLKVYSRAYMWAARKMEERGRVGHATASTASGRLFDIVTADVHSGDRRRDLTRVLIAQRGIADAMEDEALA